MKRNRFVLPTVFASIGAICNIVVSYLIAYFATGGTLFNGSVAFDFDNMWLAVTIMAMIAPVLSLIGALIIAYAPKTAGVLLIISALEYVVIWLLTPDMDATPYLVMGSIGAVILIITGIYCIAAPYIKEQIRVEYRNERFDHKEESHTSLADSKNH